MERNSRPLPKSRTLLRILKRRSISLSRKRWLRLQLLLQLQEPARKDPLPQPRSGPTLLWTRISLIQRLRVRISSQMLLKSKINPIILVRNRVRGYCNDLQQHRLLLLYAWPTQISIELLQNCTWSNDFRTWLIPWTLPNNPIKREPLQQGLLRERSLIQKAVVGLRGRQIRQEEKKEEERREKEMISLIIIK